MAERDIGGFIRREGDGNADQVAGLAVEAVGLAVDTDDAGLIGAGDPVLERLEVADAGIGLAVEADIAGGGFLDDAFGLERFAHAAGDGAELHLLEEVDEGFRVRIADGKVLDGDLYGHVLIELDEFLRDEDLIGVLDQGLAALGLFDLFGAFEKLLDGAVFVQQLGGGLHANAGGAGDVIGAVACERLDIDDLFRADAELLEDLIAPERLVLHCVEHGDLVRHQLHEVLIGRDDGDARALGLGLAGISGDEVVGFVAFNLKRVAGKGDGGFAHQRELRAKVFRRLVPVRLVVGIEIVAERVATLVEYAGKMGGAFVAFQLFQKLPEHVAEAGDRADRQAVRGAAQRGKGVEGAEDIGARIDQVEVAVFSDRCGRHGAVSLRRLGQHRV